MRVFITGASGFIGRALHERYTAEGHDVRGMDLVADAARDVVAGDVAIAGPWQDHAAGCDLVIHTAAVVSLRTERPHEVWRANVLGTANAVAAAERAGASRFVHFSSVTVFGFEFPDGVDERHPVRPTGVPYPDTKIASEQVVLQAHLEDRVPVTVVRPGDVYGPRSRAWALLPTELIRRPAFSSCPAAAAASSPRSTWTTSSTAWCSPPRRREAAGQVFTLSDGVGIANRDFFAPYAELVGRRPAHAPDAAGARRRRRGPARGPAAGPWRGQRHQPAGALRYMLRRGTYSNARARSVLGWEPRVSVEEGLTRTVDWLAGQGFGH